MNGNYEELGKISLDDLKITECSFEKDADMILLLDLAKVYYERQDASLFNQGRFTVTTSYYQRFKALTEKGTRRANVTRRYRPANHEKFTEIKAASYSLGADGKIIKTELVAEDIHTRKLNEYEDEISFSVPGVKAGCVYELAYKFEQGVSYSLPSWSFSTSCPSLYCNLTVGFLDAINYYTDTVMPNYPLSVTSRPFTSDIEYPRSSGFGMETLTGHEVSYTVTNMHSVKSEPYMNSMSNSVDHVSFQLSGYSDPLHASPDLITSFASFNRYMLNKQQFGGNLNTDGIPKKILKGLINDSMTPRQKVQAIFEHIRQSMQWDGTTGVMAKNDNAKIWKVKSGNSAEINMLLIIALRDMGFKAEPAISPVRAFGYPDTRFPMLDQFRSLLVYVPVGDEELILDASDKYLPFGLTRYDALNNFLYILRKDGSSTWFKTFNRDSNTEYTVIAASLDENGLIKGNIHMRFDNYTASGFLRAKSTNNDKYVGEQLKMRIPSANIESSSDSSDETNNHFYEDVKFSKQAVGDNDGNVYISLGDIYGQTNNPFTNPERVSDIDFGYMQKNTSVIELKIPEGYTVDSLIQPVEYTTPDSTVKFGIGSEFKDGKLYIHQRLEYKKALYHVTKYRDFYDFHQKYYKLVQQAIMLKKKK